MLRTVFIIVYENRKALVNSSSLNTMNHGGSWTWKLYWTTCSKQDLLNSTIFNYFSCRPQEDLYENFSHRFKKINIRSAVTFNKKNTLHFYLARSCLLCRYFPDPLQLKRFCLPDREDNRPASKIKLSKNVEVFFTKIPTSVYLRESIP